MVLLGHNIRLILLFFFGPKGWFRLVLVMDDDFLRFMAFITSL